MPAEALVGRTLGEFVVREPIGSGGQGLVYRAEQPALEREAVIKVLHARRPAGPETTQRFLREARLASRLDHPYAAHVYAFGAEPDGLLWIAMERVRGIPLDKLLRAQGPIPPVRLVPFLERLCEVVHSAHELGIVHRDIKPANVMVLARAGRLLPKLLDFGLAKIDDMPPEIFVEVLDDVEVVADTMTPSPAAGAVTGRGVMLGSPAYMAPEQWSDAGGATGRSDIYALGVLAYEALTGKVPFTARSVLELSRAHATLPPPPLGAGLPAALDEVIARAMGKRPEDRFATAVELGAALRRASGIVERDPLPRLADEERAAALADAPQPLADALAALDGARNVHQARDALSVTLRVAVRLLGVTALAARLQTRAGDDAPVEELRALRRRGLDDEGWLGLARALAGGRAELHAIPELVEVISDPVLVELLAARRALGDAPTEEQAGAYLEHALPLLARLLRRLAPLWAYGWVTPRGELAEGWMGLSRPRRPSASVRGAGLAGGEVGLVDARGVPVTRLHPFARVAAPAPGSPERLFLLEGPGRRGARLVAWPEGFEREDDEPWEALRALLADSTDERAAAEREESPFPGLAAFGREDAERFVGREREVEAFVNRLREQPLLCVVGASGAGKSSFVRAGVLPALGERTLAIVLRPGRAPMASLAAALRAAGVDTGDPAALRALGRPVLLVVDQLEELFTLCPVEAERESFARFLADAARGLDDEVRVILTLRDDFLMRAERLPAFRDRLAPALFLLSTPARADLVRILREPVRRVGYEWDDPALVDEMVDAVAREPGALALISFTASRLWEGRDRHFRQLRRRAYDALGGVGGALARHAEQTLAGLAPDERGLVRDAFRRLVTADGTRAVVDRDELRGAGLVEKLIEARLLVASEGEDGRERVEVVHEALLGAWPRLATWRREDAEGARLGTQLRDAARQWDERRRPAGLLWRGDALAELRLWARRFPDRLSELEADFAAASRAAERRAFRLRAVLLAAAFAALVAGIVVLLRVNAEVEAQRSRAGELAVDLEHGLVRQYLDQGRRALLADDPQLALAYLAGARQRGADSPALRFLAAQAARATEGELLSFSHQNIVVTAAYAPDGATILTASLDGSARLWHADTGIALAALPHGLGVTSARFSPDGSFVVTGGRDGGVGIWEARSGKNLHLSKLPRQVRVVAVSSDGARVAAGADDGTVRVIELAGGRVTDLRAGTQRVLALAFTSGGALVSGGGDGVPRLWRDGRVVALAAHAGPIASIAAASAIFVTGADDGEARVWDEAGRLLATLRHERGVTSVELDRDGRRVATASADRTARVWDARDGALLLRVEGHRSRVNAARFSPDGRWLATASDDTSAGVWDTETGRAIARLNAHSDAVAGVAWSPAGDRIVTASYDRRSVVWNVIARNATLRLRHAAPVAWARFDAAGGRVLTASEDGSARVWDSVDGRELHVLDVGARPTRASFSADGKLVAVAAVDGTVALWDVATGVRLGATRAHDGVAMDVAFSPDGTLLASGGVDRAVQLWGVPTLEARGTLGAAGIVNSVVFEPDGKRLLVTGQRAPEVWDVARQTRVASWTGALVSIATFLPGGQAVVGAGPEHTVRIVSFPDGVLAGEWRGHLGRVTTAVARDGLVLTASFDESARIWDLQTGDQLAVLAGHEGPVASAELSPDGRRVLTAGTDGNALVWELPPPLPLEELERLAACRSHYRLDEAKVIRAQREDCR